MERKRKIAKKKKEDEKEEGRNHKVVRTTWYI